MKNAIESSESGSHPNGHVVRSNLSGPSGDSRTVSFISDAFDRDGTEPINEGDKTVISQRPVAPPEEFYRSMPLAELASTLEGKQLDHFSVDTMIGGGGMGAVFRGVDTRLDRVVAVKVIPSSKRDADTLRRFRLEAQAAARLDHPNIARVYYVGEAEQWNYIVFEFIDGINIRDLVEMEGPLSIDDAVFYTRQVAEALQHAHERDVVHRDVKPSNVLVTANGVAKLVDMGLARDTSLDKSTADATASGVTLGTFDYISPEQARNPRDADVRSDLYSLGCTLFYMLTGHPPFPEGTALQKLLNHGSVPPPDPRGWRDDVSDQLYEVIMKLMAKRPADRYQKPADLVNDLLLLAEIEELPRSQGPTTLMLSPSVAQRTLLETNLPWMVAFAFLLGSALWLQSVQSLPNGMTLPRLKFNSETAKPSTSEDGVRTPTPIDPKPVMPAFLPRTNADNSVEIPENAQESDDLAPSDALPKLAEDISAPKTTAASPTATSSLSIIELPKLDAVATIGPPPSSTVPPPEVNKLANGAEGLGEPTVGTANPPVTSTDASVGQSSESTLVIVVASKRPKGVAAEQWDASLSQALKRSLGKPAVIEIQGRVLLDKPLLLEGQDLLIRGGSANATIDIPPGLASNADSGAAILVSQSKLKLKGLAFSATANAFSTNGVATGTTNAIVSQSATMLFRVEGSSALAIDNCLVTVDGMYPSQHSIITLGSASLTTAGISEAKYKSPAMSIAVSNSQFRGATSMVLVDQKNREGRPRQEISFENTLVAVDGVAVAVDSETGEPGAERIIRLFCNQSTFATAGGFALLNYRGGGQPLAGLSRASRGCVFWSRTGVPHVAIHSDSAGMLENPNLLLLQGFDNAYDENIENICQTFANGTAIFDLDFADGQQEGWFSEKSFERSVRWTSGFLRAQPFAQSRIGDFELKEAMFVPGFRSELFSPPTVE